MLALGLCTGLSFFWSPNFGRKYAADEDIPVLPMSHEEPRQKRVRCKTMRALQRSLSEAQKIGAGADVLKGLIRTHKATCTKCHSSV